MAKRLFAGAVLVGFLMVPLAAAAQEEEAPESPSGPFVYATYYECDPTNEWLADMIVDTVFAPIYDQAVADKTISAWGWLAHNTGGKWRRDFYTMAPTFEGLWDGGDAIQEKVEKANSAAARKISEICPAHDDYIWRWVSGSGPAGSVEATVGVSQYLVCDMAKQGRADELMAQLAPIYQRHVKEGELSGWGWLEHVVGGKYRRLLTLRGAKHSEVLAAWGAIVEEIYKEQDAVGTELDGICTMHQDYVWDVKH